MQAILTEDIPSGAKDKLYGRQNEKATILTEEHWPVMIVQNAKCGTFSVRVEKLRKL